MTDRPCFRCRIIHGFDETCAQARERISGGKTKKPKAKAAAKAKKARAAK